MQSDFMETWHTAAFTTVGLFWMALWAFGFGYLISSMIQVFVTRERMKKSMGEAGAASVGLGTLFGFLSSSCSFAALATSRSLFTKGAGLIPSLAFLLASTNLVIELGIVIAVFLSWQFVVGEYVGGVLLILLMWLLVRLTYPTRLVEQARQHARQEEGRTADEDIPDWRKLIQSTEGWRMVAMRYVMEWRMVWKDVLIGFTVAGIIAAFVPRSFFEALFVGSGSQNPAFWEVLLQAIVGPVAAFFTFIGSMGNIPLAAVLYSNGVSFAGIMAFIFSDLVVFPVLRIQAKYYGWKMALYILGIFLAVLVATAIILHYGFAAFGALPDSANAQSVTDRQFFRVDYTLFLNLAFLALSAFFLFWKTKTAGFDMSLPDKLSEQALVWLSVVALVWLAVGLSLPLFGLAGG
ncbi:permease [Methyloceanibacter caenitepidi]|uniref:Probable integral membrane protein n=1 Tax=Methyloceanibacter caenitepidi TaxID=1384459 RepID=A0A0A8K0K2_9HYPH|nr:permease [Methyloceanibacter caenitepidi]BAQ16037.1 probable integral membrane protein [Methyloceanibacter caenitepidi]